MKAPIILNNFGDVLVFDSIEKAERYIEPVDVDNNEYIAYDSDGRLLRLVSRRHRVAVEAGEEEPNHVDELRELLVDFLTKVGISRSWLLDASLHDLVAKGLEYRIE